MTAGVVIDVAGVKLISFMGGNNEKEFMRTICFNLVVLTKLIDFNGDLAAWLVKCVPIDVYDVAILDE